MVQIDFVSMDIHLLPNSWLYKDIYYHKYKALGAGYMLNFGQCRNSLYLIPASS